MAHAGESADPLDELRRSKGKELETTIEAIMERKQLTARFLEEIEVEIQSAVVLLERLQEPWTHGDRTDWESLRLAVDKALAARKKERRDRLLQGWKDVQQLVQTEMALRQELGHLR